MCTKKLPWWLGTKVTNYDLLESNGSINVMLKCPSIALNVRFKVKNISTTALSVDSRE